MPEIKGDGTDKFVQTNLEEKADKFWKPFHEEVLQDIKTTTDWQLRLKLKMFSYMVNSLYLIGQSIAYGLDLIVFELRKIRKEKF